MEFFMPMIPPTCTHQEKKVAIRKGKPVMYEPADLKAARALLRDSLPEPEEKMQGPVRLITKWCFPARGSRGDGQWKTTRPDTDNLIKLLKDEMTHRGFWKDDAQVASEITEKFWANIPGVYVKVERIG